MSSAAATVWPTSAGSRVDVRSTNQTSSAKASATASAVGCYAVSVARWVFEDGVAQARTIEGHPAHAPRPLASCIAQRANATSPVSGDRKPARPW
jgi:hypothetical protein